MKGLYYTDALDLHGKVLIVVGTAGVSSVTRAPQLPHVSKELAPDGSKKNALLARVNQ